MPEQRSQEHHRERLGEAIRDEIGLIVEGELADPRIGLATVSEVQMSPDGRSVRVYVAVDGDEEEAVLTLEGLNAARLFIRHEIADRLRLRQAPELHFALDRSQQYSARVDELLKRIKKKRK